MLEIGTVAPDFTLPDQNGKDLTLSSLKGRKVILYFYPKDNTPGCTKEACSFNEELEALTGLGAVVLGVSADGSESHLRFIAKYNLGFTLLTDAERKVMTAFEAYGKKMMYGKETVGVIRTTYLIDENGVIVKAWNKINTSVHGRQLVKAIEELSLS